MRSWFLRLSHSPIRSATSVFPLPVGSCIATSADFSASAAYVRMISPWCGNTSGIFLLGRSRRSLSGVSGTGVDCGDFLNAIVWTTQNGQYLSSCRVPSNIVRRSAIRARVQELPVYPACREYDLSYCRLCAPSRFAARFGGSRLKLQVTPSESVPAENGSEAMAVRIRSACREGRIQFIARQDQ
jgi:hypothetical protein